LQVLVRSLIPADLHRIAEELGESDLARFARQLLAFHRRQLKSKLTSISELLSALDRLRAAGGGGVVIACELTSSSS
jgi:hypothetical protein